jgi:membrane-bound lytic murein transglycosylase C
VIAEATKRRVPQALVWSVMDAESSFRPRARSHASAIGLMQLVPSSGGREAYRFVYGEDRIPSVYQLQDPEINIALGVGYLHLLLHRDFRSVRDATSRLYCTIAGYHTGPGNVARAFTGRGNVGEAINRINQMTSHRVKRTLLQHLPHRSTRTYLRTVLRNLEAYQGDD